jgi:hypothetical protein
MHSAPTKVCNGAPFVVVDVVVLVDVDLDVVVVLLVDLLVVDLLEVVLVDDVGDFEVVDLDVVDFEVVVELSTGHQALVPNIVKVGFVPSKTEVPGSLSA